ncbi:MAG: ABC transporter permease subunit [Nitrospiraceae bacterium]|nr:MAG: ABC transporter permease subunit [Nitrospiraceae bacterium]
MDFLLNSLSKAFHLIIALDPELLGIVMLSFKVSGLAIIISAAAGLFITLALDLRDFTGKKVIVTMINTFMGLPPVVAGLTLYLILSRSGPLGFLNLLYTPSAMVIVQAILATPIIAGLSYAAVVSADPSLRFTAYTLGATPFQATVKIMKNVRYSVLASVLAGLGRILAEVGAVLIVGGNIAGYTRVMTTAIALEADKGDFELAVALGIILLLIAFALNGLLFYFQRKGK